MRFYGNRRQMASFEVWRGLRFWFGTDRGLLQRCGPASFKSKGVRSMSLRLSRHSSVPVSAATIGCGQKNPAKALN